MLTVKIDRKTGLDTVYNEEERANMEAQSGNPQLAVASSGRGYSSATDPPVAGRRALTLTQQHQTRSVACTRTEVWGTEWPAEDSGVQKLR